MKRRLWVAVGTFFVLLLAAVTLLRPAPEEPSLPPVLPRFISALNTPVNPLAFRWCIDINDTGCNSTPQPIPTYHPKYTAGAGFPIGIECDTYLTTAWNVAPTGCAGDTCATTNIDWGYVDHCLTSAAANNIVLRSGEVISQPVMLMIPPYFADAESDGSCGSVADPCGAEYVPTWLESDFLFTFTYNSSVYWGYRYDSAVVLQRFKAMLNEAATLYGNNAQVALIRLNVGFQAESQPVKHGNDSTFNLALRGAHESAGVTCTEYRAFMKALAEEAFELFPNKPVIFPSGPEACGTTENTKYSEDFKWRYNFLGTTTDGNPGWWVRATPTPAGYGAYAAAADYANAIRFGPGSAGVDWGFYTSGKLADAVGAPVLFEYKYNAPPLSTATPSLINGEDKWQYNYWTALSSAGNGADWVAPYESWALYYPIQYWDVIWDKLGDHDDYAYSVQRDAEWPYYTWVAGTSGTSGARGNFENKLTLLNSANHAQACSVSLKATATRAVATAAAGGNTIEYDPCPVALPVRVPTLQPTPVADASGDTNMLQRILDRQARQVTAGGEMDFTAASDWAYLNDTRVVTLTLTYLDTGTDTLALTVPTDELGGTATHTITKTNSLLWQQDIWAVSAHISNTITTIPGLSFITLAANTGAEYIHELAVRVGDSGTPSTPTPTPTATNTITPTATLTPTVTPSVTPTFTPAPTITPTPTSTGTVTPAPTSTQTPTPSQTPSQTPTPTATPTGNTPVPPTVTPTNTPTVTNTPSATPTPSRTPTRTNTPAPVSSHTPTGTRQPGTRTPLPETPAGTRTPIGGTPAGTRTPLPETPVVTRTPLAYGGNLTITVNVYFGLLWPTPQPARPSYYPPWQFARY